MTDAELYAQARAIECPDGCGRKADKFKERGITYHYLPNQSDLPISFKCTATHTDALVQWAKGLIADMQLDDIEELRRLDDGEES